MEVKYSTIRVNGSDKKSLEILVNIDLENKFGTVLTKGVLDFRVDITEPEQLFLYGGFNRTYYILEARKFTYKIHFGFTKIKGTTLYLIDKEEYDNSIRRETEEGYMYYCKLMNEQVHSHTAFIADNKKLLSIKECYSNHINNQVTVRKPIEINDPGNIHF